MVLFVEKQYIRSSIVLVDSTTEIVPLLPA